MGSVTGWIKTNFLNPGIHDPRVLSSAQMGRRTTLVIDELVYDPSRSRGAPSLSVIRGAFLYVGGQIEGVNGAMVQIHTPVGAIWLRGTTVWGGPIDNGYGIIVLNGEVTVTGRRGAVTLKKARERCSLATENPGAQPRGRQAG
jgi:hypothetical protein